MIIGFFYSPREEVEARLPEFAQTRIYEIFDPVRRRGGWGLFLNLHFFGIGTFLTTNGLNISDAQLEEMTRVPQTLSEDGEEDSPIDTPS